MRITDTLTRPQSRELLADWYASILEDQRSSGVSITEYADEVGVSPATLYQWRRRLSPRDEFEADHILPPAPSLIEVVQAPPDRSATHSEAGFVVRLRDARSVEVPRQFDHGELLRLISTLESC